MDFDLETYLSSNDDSSGFHGDYDIDIDLNFDHFQESSMETNSELKSDDRSTDVISDDNKIESHSLTASTVSENNTNTRHKLTIPLTEMTDSMKSEIEKISNPLVVSLGGKKKSAKSRKSVNTACKTESVKSLNKSKFLQLPINPTCDKGDSLLLSKYVNEKVSDEHFTQSDNIFRFDEIPLRHASVNSKSFWLMKYLCQDTSEVENFAYLKGNILLPKVSETENDDTNLLKSKKVKKSSKSSKSRRSRKIVPLGNSSDENNNSDNVCGDRMTSGDSHSSGEVTVEGKTKFCDNCSSYPNFKLNYMSSLKERMDRIESLPLPMQQFELTNDSNVTDCEKLTMPEFFHSDDQIARYLQIRNHILVRWNECKPNYLGKRFARDGLLGCGDVNIISIVHGYLERIGAINFACGISNVVKDEPQCNNICNNLPADFTAGSGSMLEAIHGVS